MISNKPQPIVRALFCPMRCQSVRRLEVWLPTGLGTCTGKLLVELDMGSSHPDARIQPGIGNIRGQGQQDIND